MQQTHKDIFLNFNFRVRAQNLGALGDWAPVCLFPSDQARHFWAWSGSKLFAKADEQNTKVSFSKKKS